jgi:hypothetical protein
MPIHSTLRLIPFLLLLLALGHGLACDHPYFPVREGASWTYRSSGAGIETIHTQRISDVTADSFKTTTTFDDVVQETGWRCDERGLSQLDYASDVEDFHLETLETDGVSFPPAEAWAVGASWENSFEVAGSMVQEGMSLSVSGTVTNVERIIAQETVTVAAGTFEAYRVEVATTMQMSSEVMGMTIPLGLSFASTSWYAEGVGLVKSETDAGVGTVVTELTDYAIP